MQMRIILLALAAFTLSASGALGQDSQGKLPLVCDKNLTKCEPVPPGPLVPPVPSFIMHLPDPQPPVNWDALFDEKPIQLPKPVALSQPFIASQPEPSEQPHDYAPSPLVVPNNNSNVEMSEQAGAAIGQGLGMLFRGLANRHHQREINKCRQEEYAGKPESAGCEKLFLKIQKERETFIARCRQEETGFKLGISPMSEGCFDWYLNQTPQDIAGVQAGSSLTPHALDDECKREWENNKTNLVPVTNVCFQWKLDHPELP